MEKKKKRWMEERQKGNTRAKKAQHPYNRTSRKERKNIGKDIMKK